MAGPKKRSDVTIDFTGVESGGGRQIPDGEYLLEVVSIEEKESQDGNPYLGWKWKVGDGPYKGAVVYDNTSLKPAALWRLKTLLECLGMEAGGKLGLNLGELKGKSLLVNVANETYQGKQKPRITDFVRGIGNGGSGAGTSGPASSIKKGSKVKFQYEGSEMTGQVTSLDGSSVVVAVEVDGEKEEWELSLSEINSI